MSFGTRLQEIRKSMNMTQKEFAELIEVPQPSISAYENDKNNPTMDILVNIANKCNVSLDWLCGVSANKQRISSMADLIDVIFEIFETQEIGFDVDVNRRVHDDLEAETERVYARLTAYATDKENCENDNLVNLIWEANTIYTRYMNYFTDEDYYQIQKEKLKEKYAYPFTKKKRPKLSLKEESERQMEFLEKLRNSDKSK